mgnify:CR=1 FL=1
MVAFGAAVDEQRFHRDAGSLWRQDGMPANTPTVTPVCRRHWWLIHTRRHVLVKMRVCLSFRGFCHQRLCLCRLGFFCRLDPDGRQDGTGNGYENLVPLAGEIRSGHTILPAILPAGSGTDRKTPPCPLTSPPSGATATSGATEPSGAKIHHCKTEVL